MIALTVVPSNHVKKGRILHFPRISAEKGKHVIGNLSLLHPK